MLPVASCVVVKSSDVEALKDSTGKPIIRPYTPVSHPDLPGELHLLVKKYDAGNASKHIHSLKEGNTLAIKGPILKFPFKSAIFYYGVRIKLRLGSQRIRRGCPDWRWERDVSWWLALHLRV